MTRNIPLFIIILFTVLICPSFATAADIDRQLVIEDAWIAEAPPVSKVMVAYMTIKNTGPKALAITAAASDRFSSIEFHETVEDDGMVSMVRHEKLAIGSNQDLELKRGGHHLMLFNPVQRLVAGDSVEITFTIDNNTTKTVSVTVEKAK